MDKNAAVPKEEKLVNFKKAIFGVNEKEVFEYIDLLNNNLSKAHIVYEEKLAEMKSANELLSCEKNNQDEKLKQLINSYQAILEERNSLKMKIDSQKNLAEELQKALNENAEMQKQIEDSKQIANENENLKKEIAEVRAVSQVMEKQQLKLENEIELLKQQNKEITAKFLEERKQSEAKAAEKSLQLAQLLEMHRYTLKQSRSTLDKFILQFDESCKTADQIDID